MLAMILSTLLAAQEAPAPTATPAPAPAAEKQVCRRETALGTRTAKRVCRTQAEWNALASNAQAGMDQLRTRNTGQ